MGEDYSLIIIVGSYLNLVVALPYIELFLDYVW